MKKLFLLVLAGVLSFQSVCPVSGQLVCTSASRQPVRDRGCLQRLLTCVGCCIDCFSTGMCACAAECAVDCCGCCERYAIKVKNNPTLVPMAAATCCGMCAYGAGNVATHQLRMSGKSESAAVCNMCQAVAVGCTLFNIWCASGCCKSEKMLVCCAGCAEELAKKAKNEFALHRLQPAHME